MPPLTRKRVKELELAADAAKPKVKVAPSAKTKASNPAVGKRRSRISGKLALLLEMPMEIFTEVACYLSPEDLLNLARTSAGLREMLMSKSSKRIWEAARTLQDGIPVCPLDLSEPQFADLLFGKGCSFCKETRSRKLYITLRVRACQKCFDKKIVCVDKVLQTKKHHILDSITFYKMIPLIQFRYSDGIQRMAIASLLKEVLNEVEALSSSPEDLEAYIKDRRRITQAIVKSKGPIETWLYHASLQKERSNGALMKERRENIEKRLRALGYDDEDLSTRYDEKCWNWGRLLNQTRPVSERVWQNIRPQLEEIIEIRRTHAGPKFLAIRRDNRLDEVKHQWTKYRSQLNSLPLGRLFLHGDLLELPVVKEVMEENEYRLPITSERWLRVANSFPDIVAAHCKVIEMDCVKKIREARDAAFVASKSSRHRLHASVDAVDLDHAQGTGNDEDLISTCLLSATALFKRGYSSSLESYGDILRERSLVATRSTWITYHIAWSKEKIESSGTVVATAAILLERLQLPKETTMSYMLACGSGFRCLRCSPHGIIWSMTWTQLVQHFIGQNDIYEKLCQQKKTQKVDVPIRKHHDLDVVGDTASRVLRTTVELTPTGENIDRYSVLSTSWGKSIINHRVLEVVEVPCDGEFANEDEPFPVDASRARFCALCGKLGFSYFETTQGGMRWHMKNNHGTDLEGNLLPDESASKL